MAASFFVNALQVDFESVLALDHTVMAIMFKSLEETGLKGFLEASGSVKLTRTNDVFAETFGLPTEGLVGFLDIPSKTVAEMRMKFSGTDVPFRAPNKKKEVNMEYKLLHDNVAKALCAKPGSFDVVTSVKFYLMVAISAGLKVNWAHILFQTLVAMVHTPTKESQSFAIQVSVLLKNLVNVDLGESVKLHPQKVLNNKLVHIYMKKNLTVGPTGETCRVFGAAVSEQQSTEDSPQSFHKKLEKDSEMKNPEKAAVENQKKKNDRIN
ncbi:hypothetical protein F511_09099 [Dorcoceras hygrometricum]|uniref:Dystroglycan-like n=1 Tax=Dorcoceras hygrometricum TaxID=472368 RepID=A0A2Z7CXA1_9LAMI|nr:hypothetical protein F511_09099 [Dorcoceras hygrometricum]